MDDCFELSHARLMYENGVISKVEIIPDRDNCFIIVFTGNKNQRFYLKTQRGNIRYFKTLDSAYSTILSMGYIDSKLVVEYKGNECIS